MMNCFSAGLFLGMALVHMMPEAVEIHAGWAASEGIERAFPLPYVTFFLGYCLILAVDRVGADAYRRKYEKKLTADCQEANGPVEMADVNTIQGSDDKTTNQVSPQLVSAGSTMSNASECKATVSKSSAIILILAIGVHALFEGIAFGLQTEVESAAQLGIGIVIHKSAAAVSIGTAFACSAFSLKEVALFLFIFAIIAPIGIGIGMGVSETNALLDTILMGLSGGTFVYVACSEIIINEFATGKYQLWKMLLVLLGGAVISVLWFLEGDHHHHGGEGHDVHVGHDDHLL